MGGESFDPLELDTLDHHLIVDEEYESQYKRTNREQRQTPRGHQSYCFGCDRDLVGDGQKCGTCGTRHIAGHPKKRRFKH